MIYDSEKTKIRKKSGFLFILLIELSLRKNEDTIPL